MDTVIKNCIKTTLVLTLVCCSILCKSQIGTPPKDLSLMFSLLNVYQLPTCIEFSLDKRINSRLAITQGLGIPVYDGNLFDNSKINYKKFNLKSNTFLKFIVNDRGNSYSYFAINLLYKNYNKKSSDSICLNWKQDTNYCWSCDHKIYDTWYSTRQEFGVRLVFGQHFYSMSRKIVADFYFGAGWKTINNKTNYIGVNSPLDKSDDSFLTSLFPSYGYNDNYSTMVFCPLIGIQIGYNFK